jgi:hypothetical protein
MLVQTRKLLLIERISHILKNLILWILYSLFIYTLNHKKRKKISHNYTLPISINLTKHNHICPIKPKSNNAKRSITHQTKAIKHDNAAWINKNRSNTHIHVALLDIFVGVLVHAVLLAALPVEAEEAAHGHPRLIVLMEEAAGVAFHAQAAQPVPAHRLPEAPPPQPRVAPYSALRCWAGSHRDHVGVGGCSCGGI